jgi:polyribonucleotide nucleotidyltransferase
MLFKEKKYEFEIEGVKASFSTGKFARRSQASVMATMDGTTVLVNIDTKEPFNEGDFFPMSVEYIEKLYAAGKISSSRFVKRERFPSNEATLRARMIDRSFRSRFPSGYRNEMTITITVLSYDPANDPLILAINAASAALMISKAPFDGPISGVRIGLKDGKPVAANKAIELTTPEEKMNYVVSGDGEQFTMIDAGCHEVPEDLVIESMKYGLELMKPWIEAQKKFVDMVEVEKEEYTSYGPDEQLLKSMAMFLGDEVERNATADQGSKSALESETFEKLFKEYEGQYSKSAIKEAYEKLVKKAVRKLILEKEQRVDGRKLNEIRELDFEVGVLPRVHGSGLFTRGQTQALTIATLGNTRNQQLVDDMTGEELRHYMHYYNGLPFSLGEAGRIKWIPGRREVGHGALAEKALWPVVPSIEEFPYTILVMSEVLSQNGSSSMASTVGSTLALMDAGVPIKKPVAGIAMGVVTSEDGKDYRILTDIKDVEDFYGDMDFKVTGTKDGVTAVQMDNKAAGLPIEIFEVAIKQAREAIDAILERINEVMPAPRESVSQYAPKVATVKIPVEKIGELIGPGGKNIRELSEDTQTEVTVEEDGTVNIFGDTKEAIEEARRRVDYLGFVPEIGKVYRGTVAAVMEYGAFVDLVPNVAGLVHVSEMSDEFVKDVRKLVTEGQEVDVKVLDIDRTGKIKLSMKAVKKD